MEVIFREFRRNERFNNLGIDSEKKQKKWKIKKILTKILLTKKQKKE